jgi:hypothetical protein
MKKKHRQSAAKQVDMAALPPKQSVRRVHEQKARFDAAHAKGMKGLRDGDYQALDEAIREERDIIAESTPRRRVAPAATPKTSIKRQKKR